MKTRAMATKYVCVCLCSSLIVLLVGCGTPNKANIELRKQNQALRDEVEQLKTARQADAATIAALEQRQTTVPFLPQERVQQLFTAHGFEFGRLTGGADLDRQKPGDEGVKVYVAPTDQAGQPLKAAGAWTVELFDLAREGQQQIGEWTFPIDEAAKNWYGQAMLYTYVLTCPWQSAPPVNSELTLKVTFVDGLTQREFTAQRVIVVDVPPAGAGPNTTAATTTQPKPS